jgi:branched-chain amino acid transport system ATP-binding protein
MSATILSVSRLCKQFGGLIAVSNVDFDVRESDIYGIIGPNGAGKTTIFNMIAGAFPPTSGDILFNGKSIIKEYTYNVARMGISRTFQNTRILHNMTVAENIFVGGIQTYKSGIVAGLLGLQSARSEKAALSKSVFEELAFLGISEFAHYKAVNLAYGHQRLLEIARALISRPKLLLLDEPGAGMNPSETAELIGMLNRIRDRGITTIVIEHDMKFIRGICNRVLVVNTGETIVEGTPKEVLSHPDVIKAYLGGAYVKES